MLDLTIHTGCRLHFGLMELCSDAPNCYAGLGLMLDKPGYEISFSAPDEGEDHLPLEVRASAKEKSRIAATVERFHSKTGRLPVSSIAVKRSLPLHHGLGAGTQLASAITAGLILSQRARPRPSSGSYYTNDLFQSERELAALSGRGLRSAIGLTGFLQGGLILDDGYLPRSCSTEAGPQAEMARSVSTQAHYLPESWRVLLLQCAQKTSIHGTHETNLLKKLGSTPNPSSLEMRHMAIAIQDCLASDRNFESFASSLERYTDLAGTLFKPIQGGIFSCAAFEQAAKVAQRCGLRAVGQSSWGPTVFGFCETPEVAEEISSRIHASAFTGSVQICQPAQHGARLEIH